MPISSKNGEIEIYGVLKRNGGDNKLGYTNQLYDTTLNKFQSEINQNNIDYKNAVDNHLKDYTNPHKVSKEQVGLSEVTNDAQVKRSEMGLPLGVATLDKLGKVPESLLSKITEVERIKKSIGPYSDRADIILTASLTGYVVNKDGVKTAKNGWAIAEFTAELGNIYLFNPGETSSDVCLFAEYIDKVETRAIDYTYTYDENGRVLTAKATYNGKTYIYTYDYSSSITSITDQYGDNVSSLPSVYTTTVGTYLPMTILNANAELPEDGYYRFVSNFTTALTIKIVVSYKISSADITMKVIRDGSTANMCSQLAKINKKVDNVSASVPKMWISICYSVNSTIEINGKEILLNAHKMYKFNNVQSINICLDQKSANTKYLKHLVFHYNEMNVPFLKAVFGGYARAVGEGYSDIGLLQSTLDVSGWDTSKMNAAPFFYCASNLTFLDVSGWDTSKMVTMSNVFNRCTNLKILDVSGWDVSSCRNFNNIFDSCESLKTIDVSKWDVSNAEKIDCMFARCLSLSSLDLSNWNLIKCYNMSNMFGYLTLNNLTTLKLGENFGKMRDEAKSVNFLGLPNWKNDSVKTLLSLYDRKANGMGVITLRLHANTKKVLGEDGIALLTAKGYIIA